MESFVKIELAAHHAVQEGKLKAVKQANDASECNLPGQVYFRCELPGHVSSNPSTDNYNYCGTDLCPVNSVYSSAGSYRGGCLQKI